MFRHGIAIFGLLAALLGPSLAGCGAGFALTKPGGTVQDYLDDQSACKAAVAKNAAPQPAGNATAGAAASQGAKPASTAPLGGRIMDPRVYNCMLAKGWQPPS